MLTKRNINTGNAQDASRVRHHNNNNNNNNNIIVY